MLIVGIPHVTSTVIVSAIQSSHRKDSEYDADAASAGVAVRVAAEFVSSAFDSSACGHPWDVCSTPGMRGGFGGFVF